MTNSVADLAIRVKNGYLAGKPAIEVMYSKFNTKIVEILKQEGYIADFSLSNDGAKQAITVELLYKNNQPVVSDVVPISKPGRRMYTKSKYLKPVIGGLGISIVSTPKVVMTDKNAKKMKVGGEVLFKIW